MTSTLLLLVTLAAHAAAQETPNLDAVRAALAPLRYSSLPALESPDAGLTFDAADKTWTLRGLRRYDDSGRVRLADGRSGICSELVARVAPRLRELFPAPAWEIEAVSAVESGFFGSPTGGHFVILIHEIGGRRRTLLLDPTFARYGPVEAFKNYEMLGPAPEVLEGRLGGEDVVLPLLRSYPLLLTPDAVLNLAAGTVDDRLDAGHHFLAVMVRGKHRYRGEPGFVVRRSGGELEAREFPAWKDLVLDAGLKARIERRVLSLLETAAVRTP